MGLFYNSADEDAGLNLCSARLPRLYCGGAWFLALTVHCTAVACIWEYSLHDLCALGQIFVIITLLMLDKVLDHAATSFTF